MLDISIIIPVFNEEENLKLLFEDLQTIANKINKSYEIIFIDDGSTDRSYEILKSLKGKDKNIKIIKLRRNFGQTYALQVGFEYAKGDVLITMDADRQNDPNDIPKLLKKIEEDFDVVSGWRKKRKDKFLSRRLPSFLANLLISLLTGVKLHDYGCTLKAYKREIVESICLYGETHRFIPALCSMQGAKITEVEVSHHPRRYGKSKYGLKRTLRVILDLITLKFFLSYLSSPMQVFGLIGFFLFILGAILSIYLFAVGFIFKHELIYARGYLIVDALLLLMGVQFIFIGLLGEMISKIYFESHRKSNFMIKEIIE